MLWHAKRILNTKPNVVGNAVSFVGAKIDAGKERRTMGKSSSTNDKIEREAKGQE